MSMKYDNIYDSSRIPINWVTCKRAVESTVTGEKNWLVAVIPAIETKAPAQLIIVMSGR